MPILLFVLLAGTLAYLWWRWRTTTLTRDCRWRRDRAAGLWRCVACGGEVAGDDDTPPKVCVRRAS